MAKALMVHLSGTLILDLNIARPDARPDARPVTLLLKPVTRELIKADTNTLTLDVVPGGKGLKVSLRDSL